jgi:aminopeptidase N
VPGTNLTRAEARERSGLVSAASYAVDLDFTGPGDTYRSTTVLRFSSAEVGAATFVDLVAPRVHDIVLNGVSLDPSTAYREGRIHLRDLAATNELRVVADCAYMNTGEGLHRTVDPVDGNVYLYTHFEVPEARRVFATFEQPDLKAPFTFTVTAPRTWTVLSNSPTPEPEPVSAAASVWRFAPTPPIATYLTAVVAGDYHVVRDTYAARSGQVVPLAVACRASAAAYLDPDEIFEVTKQGFDYYLETFARPYPFEKYDQIFVPEYNIGAMENAGCVTFREQYVFRSKVTEARRAARANTILHEMAHMWFGDLVTMRWWDDLWLKESFATYMGVRCQAEATRWTDAWTTFANDHKANGQRQDRLPSTHPIVADIRDLEEVQINFDGITYSKGAAVLKQLVAWVGDTAFIDGVRRYFDRHAWGSTTLADLLAALEETSGRDLTDWSREWLQSAGPNTLRPEYEVDADGRFAGFAVLQSAPPEHPTLRSHRLAIGLYRRGGAGLTRVRRIELDVTGSRTEVPELLGERRPDLVLLNDDDLTYAAIRLDAHSMSTLMAAIGEFADSLPRALCWSAAWDMVRTAELPARSYLRMVLGGIGTESEIGVVQTLHETLVTSLADFVDPAARPDAGAEVTRAARGHLAAASPGSDAQLAWVQLLARVAATGEDLELIAGLLDGTVVPDGLRVDTELRWALLAALVRTGQAGADAIEAELARDRTTAGEEYAAGSLAARPDAAAKAAAWASLVERADLPNDTQKGIIGWKFSRIGLGFGQPSQQHLLEGYVDRYFAAIGEIWTSRTMETARNIVGGLYPRYVIDETTIERTDAFLNSANPPPALRRLVIEGRDDVQRALRARALDRSHGSPP